MWRVLAVCALALATSANAPGVGFSLQSGRTVAIRSAASSATTTTTLSTTTSTGAGTTTTSTTSGPTTSTTLGVGDLWVFDVAGNDGNAGTAAAPWRTFAHFQRKLNDGTIGPGDTVRFKPGRYAACETLSYPYEGFDHGGGSPAAPVLVTIDTGTAGDVEIHGGARPGICNVPTWTQARKCTAGTFVDSLCAIDFECGTGGTCADLPGVWWTTSAFDNNSAWYGGINAGVAYQPRLAAGGSPKIYEILYAPDTPRLTVPAFTSGRAQMFPVATQPAAGFQASYCLGVGSPWACCRAAGVGCEACTAARTPWQCCTGLGTGPTCDHSRVYVQQESGARPDIVSTADAAAGFGPVEFPFKPSVFWNGSLSGTPLHDITFSNGSNGRQFHFRWALTGTFMFKNADGLTFEDFTTGYTSRVNSYLTSLSNGSANAARFPRYQGGDTYQITGWPCIANVAAGFNCTTTTGTNVVRNFVFRRGKVHGSFANEQIHFLGGPNSTHQNILFDGLEIGDGPFAVAPNTSGTTLTPNANTNQVTKSWPPPGYGAWASVYDTGYWGPLGGGGNTDGAFISSSHKQTIRNCYLHDSMLMSFFESGGGGDLLFENNRVDLARVYLATGGTGAHPPMLITAGATEGRLAVTIGTRFNEDGCRGPIVRNNEFLNVYGNALRTGMFFNDPDEYPAFKPITAPQIVNNTFHIKGDGRYASTIGNLPVVWFWQTCAGVCSGGGTPGARCVVCGAPNTCGAGSCVPAGWSNDAQDGTKLIFKNNIFYHDTVPTVAQPLVVADGGAVDPPVADIDFDYNIYGGVGMRWQVAGATQTDFASWVAAVQAYGASNESHSLNADPLLVSPATGNVSLTVPGSPAYQSGLDLHTVGPLPFATDITGAARPNGAWSRGAYQGAATGLFVAPPPPPPPPAPKRGRHTKRKTRQNG